MGLTAIIELKSNANNFSAKLKNKNNRAKKYHCPNFCRNKITPSVGTNNKIVKKDNAISSRKKWKQPFLMCSKSCPKFLYFAIATFNCDFGFHPLHKIADSNIIIFAKVVAAD